MNLHNLLIEKAARNQLAHFYILETNLDEKLASTELMSFVSKFLQIYFKDIEKAPHPLTNLMDHPDIFVMGTSPEYEDKKDPSYLVSEAENMIRFFEFKSVQSKRKFAIIPQGHLVTTYVANKWLKLLEEPSGNSTIFLLNPRGQKLLETIHSRAQHLRLPATLPNNNLDELKLFLSNTAQQSLSVFIESQSKSDKDVAYWSQELIRWEASQDGDYQSKLALTLWLRQLQDMETYHQPSATKWTLFYSYLGRYVLSRLSR